MSTNTLHDLKLKYADFSTEELLTIVQQHSLEYRPVVVNLIVDILESRGEQIDRTQIKYGNPNTIKHDLVSEKSSNSLLIYGIVILLSSIAISAIYFIMGPRDLRLIHFVLKLIISLVSMKLAYDYAKGQKRNGILFGFLGFIFGGLLLIILSFIKSPSSRPDIYHEPGAKPLSQLELDKAGEENINLLLMLLGFEAFRTIIWFLLSMSNMFNYWSTLGTVFSIASLILTLVVAIKLTHKRAQTLVFIFFAIEMVTFLGYKIRDFIYNF